MLFFSSPILQAQDLNTPFQPGTKGETKAYICGAIIQIRVLFHDFDSGEHSYFMDLHNVYPSCTKKGKPSAYWKYGGNQPGNFISSKELRVKEGLYYWAKVDADCVVFDGGCASNVANACVKQVQWMCDITKLEINPPRERWEMDFKD